MSITTDIMQVTAVLGLVGLGVAGIALARPSRDADEHDLSDYHAPKPAPKAERVKVAPVRRDWPELDRDEPARVRPLEAHTEPVTLAAWTVPWRPPYAELVVAQVVRRYGDSPADRAARMLREIAAEQRTPVGAR
ncbi:hypothetical protein [Micromonospora marina]|uniref:hypothetical protein n=1 Tax=Micromonospora marina TaxID=307120 RepID=UPI003454A5AB